MFYNIVLETKETISKDDSHLITGNKRYFTVECFIKNPNEMLELIAKREKYEKELEQIISKEKSDNEWSS